MRLGSGTNGSRSSWPRIVAQRFGTEYHRARVTNDWGFASPSHLLQASGRGASPWGTHAATHRVAQGRCLDLPNERPLLLRVRDKKQAAMVTESKGPVKAIKTAYLEVMHKKAELEARVMRLSEIQSQLHNELSGTEARVDEGRAEVAAVDSSLSKLEGLSAELKKQYESLLQSRRDALADLHRRKEKLSADLNAATDNIKQQLEAREVAEFEILRRNEELRAALAAELEGLDAESKLETAFLTDMVNTLRELDTEYRRLQEATEAERVEQRTLVEATDRVKAEEAVVMNDMAGHGQRLQGVTERTAVESEDLSRLKLAMETLDKEIKNLEREKKTLTQRNEVVSKSCRDIQGKEMSLRLEIETAVAKTGALQELRDRLLQEDPATS